MVLHFIMYFVLKKIVSIKYYEYHVLIVSMKYLNILCFYTFLFYFAMTELLCVYHVSAESSTGTPGSLEHSLDSDSDPDEEQGRSELQPPSPTDQALDGTTEDQMRPSILLVNLQCPSGSNDPPALPESEPPELDETEEVPTSPLAALNINQNNNTTKTLAL